jgi:pyruvate/2-oxoglutarate dehydrogenase complex dihydrolipoamide acyltransferase (E2) component
MSAPGHAETNDAHAAHDHYEGIAADQAAPDEPESPAWLPLLGLGLLISGVLGYVLMQPAGKTAKELAAAAEPTPAPSASAAPAPEAPSEPQAARRPPRPMPSVVASGAMPRLARPMGSGVVQPGRPPGVFAVPGDPSRAGGARVAPAPGGADPHAGHNH